MNKLSVKYLKENRIYILVDNEEQIRKIDALLGVDHSILYDEIPSYAENPAILSNEHYWNSYCNDEDGIKASDVIEYNTLPDKWCVKRNNQLVVDYCNEHGVMPPYCMAENSYAHFPAFHSGQCTTSGSIEHGYTEITFERFCDVVLGGISIPKQPSTIFKHGQRCVWEYDDMTMNGKISICRDRVYVCQNVKNGDDCTYKFGYQYSWAIGKLYEYSDEELMAWYGKITLLDDIDSNYIVVSDRLLFTINKKMLVKINEDKVNVFMNPSIDLLQDGYYKIAVEKIDKNSPNSFDVKNGEVSYFTGEQEINDNGKWSREGRQVMKPSKFLKLLRPYITIEGEVEDEKKIKDRYIELICGEIKDTKVDIKISDDILNVYETTTGDSGTGTLGTSCMRPETDYDGKRFIQYYNEIDNLKIAYATKGEKLIARALLWHDVNSDDYGDSLKFMDRIYGSEASIKAFKEWAKENGYWWKKEQSYSNNYITNGSYEVDDMEITIDTSRVLGFPYMDTMCCLDGECLNTNVGFSLQETNGMTVDGDERGQTCSCCGEYIREDEVYSHGDYVYCQDCFCDRYTYCDRCGCSVDRDDAIYCGDKVFCDETCAERNGWVYLEHSNEWIKRSDAYEVNDAWYSEEDYFDLFTCCDNCSDTISIDDTTETSDGNSVCSSCLEEYYRECEECGEYHPKEDVIEIEGNYYCEECAEEIKVEQE